jgi:putative peptide zinc metalloprotease protein
VPEQPVRAAQVDLVGALLDTGFAHPQWLVEREGHYLHVTELLYRILQLADGQRTCLQIAAEIAAQTGKPINAANVRTLLATKLLPLGLIAPGDAEVEAEEQDRVPAGPSVWPPNVVRGLSAHQDTDPAGLSRARQTGRRRSSPFAPLQLTLRLGVLGPQAIDPVARALQVLFLPPVCVAVVLLVGIGQGWLFLGHGVGSVIALVLFHPLLFLLLFGFVLLSGLLHEFGHAAALRYGGGRARSIGFGLYVTVPAFYTDCTDSYRLDRWGRLRTDLGGVYINLLMTLALLGLFALTHAEALLAAVLLLDIVIAQQFSPLVRYDGYWALADLIGVPDFFTLMSPVLRGLVPHGARRGHALPVALKGWVRAVFIGYTVIVVPLLCVALFLLVARAPLLLGLYAGSFLQLMHGASSAWRRGDGLGVGLAGVQALVLLVSAVLLVYGVGRLLSMMGTALLAWGRASVWRRALATLAVVGVTALLALFWMFWMLQVAGSSHATPHAAPSQPHPSLHGPPGSPSP